MIIPPDMSSRIAFLTQMAQDAQASAEALFYVRIPGNIHPLERESRFEQPLDAILREAAAGQVAGAGEQMAANGEVAYCGLDVYLNDRAGGLEVLRQALQTLGVPEGTAIEEFLPQWREHRL